MRNTQEIKSYLLKVMENVWQRNEDDIENMIKYDPVVKLLFNALVYQFEDINDHISNFKKEILQDLSKRLLPDHYFFALPAFGIVHAKPSKNEVVTLKQDKLFTTPRKINDQITNLSFIPITNTTLIPGNLKVISTNNTIYSPYEKDNELILQQVFFSHFNTERTLWFGLDIPDEIFNTLSEIPFFVDYDIANYENRLKFESIVNADWSVSNRQCIANKGFPQPDGYNFGISSSSRLSAVKSRIYHFYSNNYITLTLEKVNSSQRSQLHQVEPPEEIKDKYPKINQWIKIECNTAVPIEFFIDNNLMINAFPVINCDIKSDKLTRNEPIKTFKLVDREHFFELVLNDSNDRESGFLIRNTRFNSFDTKDLDMELRTLNRLFNQARLKFERNPFIEEEDLKIFREFTNILIDINTRIKNENLKLPEENISSLKNFDRLREFRYMTTFGAAGNGGEVADEFKYSGMGIENNTAYALTPFNGGVDPLDENKQIDHLRYLLISRNRIVTREDIRALSHMILGEKVIKRIDIKKTTLRGTGSSGLHRALKIEIKLNTPHMIEKDTIDFMRKELIGQLENKSFNVMPFIVEIY